METVTDLVTSETGPEQSLALPVYEAFESLFKGLVEKKYPALQRSTTILLSESYERVGHFGGDLHRLIERVISLNPFLSLGKHALEIVTLPSMGHTLNKSAGKEQESIEKLRKMADILSLENEKSGNTPRRDGRNGETRL